MSHFEIRHTFDISEDDFWNHTFFDPEFNQELYFERLGFAQWKVQKEETQKDGSKKRRVLVEPKMEIPSALKRFIGEGMAYVEDGTWDPKTKRYHFRIEPSKLTDKIDVHGVMWTEARGEGRCERIISVDAKVKIFGVGKMAENFLEKSITDSYEEAARFTHEWKNKKGL